MVRPRGKPTNGEGAGAEDIGFTKYGDLLDYCTFASLLFYIVTIAGPGIPVYFFTKRS